MSQLNTSFSSVSFFDSLNLFCLSFYLFPLNSSQLFFFSHSPLKISLNPSLILHFSHILSIRAMFSSRFSNSDSLHPSQLIFLPLHNLYLSPLMFLSDQFTTFIVIVTSGILTIRVPTQLSLQFLLFSWVNSLLSIRPCYVINLSLYF